MDILRRDGYAAKRVKKFLCLLVGLTMSISINACGLRNVPEPVLDEAESTPGEESKTIAVADFYHMQLPINVVDKVIFHYAINDEYLYYTDISYKGGEIGALTQVVRKRISDGHTEEEYIVSERKRTELLEQVLLVDGEGCCYLLWVYGPTEGTAGDILWDQHLRIEDNLAIEEEVIYSLEKYGADGKLLWHRDYTPEEFQMVGRTLYQGVVTTDGRIYLYTYGESRKIFAFSPQGELEETYAVDLETLDGVAVGKDNRVYAYCITGAKRVFLEIGGDGKSYVSPVKPLQVYSGNEFGIYLNDKKGMWSYEPETGETELLWGWDDEYVQINASDVDCIFPGDRGCMLISMEDVSGYDNYHDRERVLTLAMISPADSRDYSKKQPITLAVSYNDASSPNKPIDKMVKLYNRHSKKYRVNIITEDAGTLEKNLLRGEGADLINLDDYYAENLAEMGAFEDLEPYYKASGVVAEEDILEPVRQACTVRGKKVGVVPSFCIKTLMAKDTRYTYEEWDVRKFLEMAQENRMFQYQSPVYLFERCMGIRYAEHFVDWAKKECHFDSEEFRRCLEACRNCAVYEYDPSVGYLLTSFEDSKWEDGWFLVEKTEIQRTWDIVSFFDDDPEYSAKLIGYPGWDGGEYELIVKGMFAINSDSKNKEGAWDFLEYLLSEEYQKLLKEAFPVRKDCIEIYLNDLYDPYVEFSEDIGEPSKYGSREEHVARMREMLDAAVFNDWRGKINPLRDIISEEVQMYFAGDATLDETVNKIQNRVQLYLDEH